LFSFNTSKTGQEAVERLKFYPLGDDSDCLLERLKNFQVKDAHCYDPNEETKLRHIIEANGEDEFNRRVSNLACQAIDSINSNNTSFISINGSLKTIYNSSQRLKSIYHNDNSVV
jgi:hypothetical protein